MTRRLLLGLVLAVGCARTPPNSILDQPLPSRDSFADHVVLPDESWQQISELYFGDATRAERIANEAGANLATAPRQGDALRIRIPPQDMDRVRRIEVARGPYNEGVELLRAGGEDQAALDAFERALELAPYFVDARYNRGLALLRLDRAEESAATLRDVAESRPGDKDVDYALGSAYFQLEEYEAAVARMEQALKVDARFLRAQFTKAMSLQRLQRSAEARAAWKRYLELDSTSSWADEARRQLGQL